MKIAKFNEDKISFFIQKSPIWTFYFDRFNLKKNISPLQHLVAAIAYIEAYDIQY